MTRSGQPCLAYRSLQSAHSTMRTCHRLAVPSSRSSGTSAGEGSFLFPERSPYAPGLGEDSARTVDPDVHPRDLIARLSGRLHSGRAGHRQRLGREGSDDAVGHFISKVKEKAHRAALLTCLPTCESSPGGPSSLPLPCEQRREVLLTGGKPESTPEMRTMPARHLFFRKRISGVEF